MYTVIIKETLMEELKIEAATPNDALDKAMKIYSQGDALPSSEKYIDVRFSVEESA